MKLKTLTRKSKKMIKYTKKSLHKRFAKWLKDFTIPHPGNNHHPKGLHPHALTGYVIAILLVKVFVTGSLFFLYPNIGFVTSKITDDLYEITNQERLAAGLNPLTVNPELVASAQRKADDMVAGSYFSHISPDGTKPWEWINKSNYNFTHMGENLAMDFSSAKIVHTAFMNSPSHKANILHEDYTDFGMVVMPGVINGKDTMILVQFYGKSKVTDTLAVATTDSSTTSVPVEQPTTVVVNDNVVSEPEVTVQGIDNTSENIPEEINTELNEVISAEVDKGFVVEDNATTTMVGQIDNEINYIPNAEMVVVKQPGVQAGLVDLMISWSRNFMTLMLVIVSMLLVVNVMVRFRVQHSHVIAHSLLVIGFIAIMLFTQVHVLEKFVL